MTSVFLSSTCYDLIDLRAEIDRHLRELDLNVMRSDSQDFEVEPDENSIETCLARVREADHFICILSRRYGPSLKKAGYPDVSATHLEYTEALRQGKNITFCVRDRLIADYSIYKKMDKDERDTAFRPAFAQEGDHLGLFQLIDAHQRLDINATTSNWIEVFDSVVDLKRVVSRRLKTAIRTARIHRLLEEGQLPVFALQPRGGSGSEGKWRQRIEIRNVGKQVALDVAIRLTDQCDWKLLGSLEASACLETEFLLSKRAQSHICEIRFDTILGDRLQASFEALADRGGPFTEFRRQPISLISTNNTVII